MSTQDQPVMPWWRVRMVWLVVGGPALVVAASIATLVLAVRGGDLPLREEAAVQQQHPGYVPATQARNHAAAPRR
jgi:uncharacterized protein